VDERIGKSPTNLFTGEEGGGGGGVRQSGAANPGTSSLNVPVRPNTRPLPPLPVHRPDHARTRARAQQQETKDRVSRAFNAATPQSGLGEIIIISVYVASPVAG